MESMPKLIAIKDFENKGKSTTIWLLLFTLVNKLNAELLYLYNQNENREMEALPEEIPSGWDMYDIYAVVRWKGLKIVIIGRGDYEWAILEDMKCAVNEKLHYIINAIHERQRNHDIWNAYNAAYPNTEYERVCLWSEHTDEASKALNIKEPTVSMILKYIEK